MASTYYADEKTLNEVNEWFKYHAPKEGQSDRYVALREKGKELALLILAETPRCADQSAAIRKLRECIMTANAAIACNE